MFNKTLITSLMLVAVAAQAEVTVSGVSEFTVKGKIVKAPCALTLTGLGNVDFGTLSTAQVQAYATAPNPTRYFSEQKNLDLKVVCDGLSRVALEFLDNRAASVSSEPDTIRWGLGTYTKAGGTIEQKIGAYNVHFGSNITLKPTIGGVAMPAAQVMYVNGLPTTNSNWAQPIGYEISYLAPGKTLGLSATAGKMTPDAVSEIKMTLAFVLEIMKDVIDEANSDIIFNGAGTVTLVSL